jgi:hypothetical protein
MGRTSEAFAVVGGAAVRWALVAGIGAACFMFPLLLNDSLYPFRSPPAPVLLVGRTVVESLICGCFAAVAVGAGVALLVLAAGVIRGRLGFPAAHAGWRRVAFAALAFGLASAAAGVAIVMRS